MIVTAVYDCMVLLQALSKPDRTSGNCFRAVIDGRVRLAVSNATLLEVEDVVNRPDLRERVFKVTDAQVRSFLDLLVRVSVLVADVPMVCRLPGDRKDEKHLNLAIAAHAEFIVTRDNLLLGLMTAENPDAFAFRAAHPTIETLLPETFLARLA